MDPVSVAVANLVDSLRLLVVVGVPAAAVAVMALSAYRARRRERADELRRY